MSFLNEINSKGDILLERLRSLADGKTQVKLFDEINHAALDIIAIYFPPSWFTFIYVQEQLVIVIIETTFSRYLSFFFN